MAHLRATSLYTISLRDSPKSPTSPVVKLAPLDIKLPPVCQVKSYKPMIGVFRITGRAAAGCRNYKPETTPGSVPGSVLDGSKLDDVPITTDNEVGGYRAVVPTSLLILVMPMETNSSLPAITQSCIMSDDSDQAVIIILLDDLMHALPEEDLQGPMLNRP